MRAVVNLGFCRYAGKGEGEVSQLRRLWDVLAPGDALLGDGLMSGWVGMHLLQVRCVDTVSPVPARLTKPDPIVNAGPLLCGQRTIVPWPAQ